MERRRGRDRDRARPILAQRLEGEEPHRGPAHRRVRRPGIPADAVEAALPDQEAAGPQEAGPLAPRDPVGAVDPSIRGRREGLRGSRPGGARSAGRRRGPPIHGRDDRHAQRSDADPPQPRRQRHPDRLVAPCGILGPGARPGGDPPLPRVRADGRDALLDRHGGRDDPIPESAGDRSDPQGGPRRSPTKCASSSRPRRAGVSSRDTA